MKTRSLLVQLLGWQLLVTGVACLLLVIGTLAGGAAIIRHDQDRVLSALADTMCNGIQSELVEQYPNLDMARAAEHYFAESPLKGHRLEYRHHSDGLLAARGPFPEMTIDTLGLNRSGRCGSVDTMDEQERVTVRACAAWCDEKHIVNVASRDALTQRDVRRAALILIGFLPLALIVGGVAGRWVLARSLAPLRQLRDAAGGVEAGPSMTLGIGARTEELAQLEGAFDKLLKRVGTMVEREKRFSQEASHELRTPLTNIRLRLEKIKGRATRDPGLVAELDAALRNLDSLDDLLEGLLLLARSETAALPLAPVNLCDVARDAALNLSARRPPDSPSLDLEAPDEILVLGNEELLARAVGNVVENAHEYAGKRCRIRIRVYPENGSGVICVDDDGPGIAPEHRKLVFERFFRGPRERTKTSGTGLGLAVVTTIVERHSGAVEIGASDLGGERVSISIPLI